MPLTPLAAEIKATLLQECTVEPFDSSAGTSGYDEHGQEIYGAPRTAPCRIVPKQARQLGKDGDLHGAWGTVVMFAADDPISDRDRITLPGMEDRGPIVVQVAPYYDAEGQLTHKEVAI